MNKPEISVIIASYNQKALLPRAIDSVISQSIDVPFEVIVIDDGSTDGSQDIEKDYKNVSNLLWINESHRGIMNTYNTGLTLCRGKYIAFCDCDDYWIDDYKLARQYYCMATRPWFGLCTTRVFTRSGNDMLSEKISTDEINEKLSYNSLLKGTVPIHAQSYFIRKEVLDKYVDFSIFVKRKFNTWDYPIVLELINHTRFYCLGFYSAVYVKQVESTTRTVGRKKRIKYLLGNYRIKLYFIGKYGCQMSTLLYLFYKLVRDTYSIIFKRWVG